MNNDRGVCGLRGPEEETSEVTETVDSKVVRRPKVQWGDLERKCVRGGQAKYHGSFLGFL